MVHQKEKKYLCKICEKSFAHNFLLKTHNNTVHLKLKPFECNICTNKFGTSSNLNNHVKNIHKKIKSINCDFCKIKFDYNNDTIINESFPFKLCETCSQKLFNYV